MKFDLKQFKESGGRIHLLGCAGAGTGPLASIFLDLGFSCSGSDLLSTKQTERLAARGMAVFKGHAKENLPAGDKPLLLVYTSAVAEDNPELAEAHRRGVPCMKRGEALAHLGTLFPHTIAVAGSHGKTSVTALIAHILKELGLNPGFLIGGSVCGWNTAGTAGAKQFFVTEVDESDSTNALFHAETAVVTNIEDDHSWSVGGEHALFQSFVLFASGARNLLYAEGDHTSSLFAKLPGEILTESAMESLSGYPGNWGGFQRRNAYTAIRTVRCALNGTVSEDRIKNAAFSFPGVERRLTVRFDSADYRIIEDYAHHPTELKASLEALRETNPDRRLVVIFQPHRYARLQKYLNEFAGILWERADVIFLVPVFAAWTDVSDVDSGTLADRIGSGALVLTGSWEEQARKAEKQLQPGDLIAVIGAGDVKEIIAPLKKLLQVRF